MGKMFEGETDEFVKKFFNPKTPPKQKEPTSTPPPTEKPEEQSTSLLPRLNTILNEFENSWSSFEKFDFSATSRHSAYGIELLNSLIKDLREG